MQTNEKEENNSEWREKRKRDLSFAQRRGRRRESEVEEEKKKKKSGMFSQDGSVCGGDITTTRLQWKEDQASILRDRGIEEEYPL